MITKKEEDQFWRGGNEQEGKTLIQSQSALINGFGEATDTDSRMLMGLTPGVHYCIHGFTD